MPDNAFYAYASYVAAAAVYGVYALSIWRRRRQVRRLLRDLERAGESR